MQKDREEKMKQAIQKEEGLNKFRATVKAISMKSSATQEQLEKLTAAHKIESENLKNEIDQKSNLVGELETKCKD